MIRCWSTRCFLAPWLELQVQWDSWCKTLAIHALHRYRIQRRLLWACGLCFNYRKYILLIISWIHFPWCQTCYFASNRRNNPQFGVRTEGLCMSLAIEVNVNFFTIAEVLPRNWFGTSRLLHFDDLMLIYTLFSTSLLGTWGTVGLWWCKTRVIRALHWYQTRQRLLWARGSGFNYRKYILLIIS
jgi:hypothetical protein